MIVASFSTPSCNSHIGSPWNTQALSSDREHLCFLANLEPYQLLALVECAVCIEETPLHTSLQLTVKIDKNKKYSELDLKKLCKPNLYRTLQRFATGIKLLRREIESIDLTFCNVPQTFQALPDLSLVRKVTYKDERTDLVFARLVVRLGDKFNKSPACPSHLAGGSGCDEPCSTGSHRIGDFGLATDNQARICFADIVDRSRPSQPIAIPGPPPGSIYHQNGWQNTSHGSYNSLRETPSGSLASIPLALSTQTSWEAPGQRPSVSSSTPRPSLLTTTTRLPEQPLCAAPIPAPRGALPKQLHRDFEDISCHQPRGRHPNCSGGSGDSMLTHQVCQIKFLYPLVHFLMRTLK